MMKRYLEILNRKKYFWRTIPSHSGRARSLIIAPQQLARSGKAAALDAELAGMQYDYQSTVVGTWLEAPAERLLGAGSSTLGPSKREATRQRLIALFLVTGCDCSCGNSFSYRVRELTCGDRSSPLDMTR